MTKLNQTLLASESVHLKTCSSEKWLKNILFETEEKDKWKKV